MATPLDPAPAAPAGRGKGASPSLRAQLVRQLRDRILSGQYRAGDRLNESRIAREFAISRIPVREALSQLQEQGLVQAHARRGMFVTDIGAEDVRQISSLRLILESEALVLARARMTPALLAELDALVARMDDWDGDLLQAAALDLQFHRALWRAAGNPYLERALNTLIVPLFAHKTLEHVTHEVRRWRLSHHRFLLDAVAGRSQDDPQAVLLTHLRMSCTEPERYSTLARPPS